MSDTERNVNTQLRFQAKGLHLHECMGVPRHDTGWASDGGGSPHVLCQSAADPHSDHQAGCGSNEDMLHHHNSIRDALLSAAHSAALQHV